MQAANDDAFPGQDVAQHAAPGEWIFQMQFVDPPHQHEVGGRDPARQIVDVAQADAEFAGLSCNRQIM